MVAELRLHGEVQDKRIRDVHLVAQGQILATDAVELQLFFALLLGMWIQPCWRSFGQQTRLDYRMRTAN